MFRSEHLRCGQEIRAFTSLRRGPEEALQTCCKNMNAFSAPSLLPVGKAEVNTDFFPGLASCKEPRLTADHLHSLEGKLRVSNSSPRPPKARLSHTANHSRGKQRGCLKASTAPALPLCTFREEGPAGTLDPTPSSASCESGARGGHSTPPTSHTDKDKKLQEGQNRDQPDSKRKSYLVPLVT